MTDTSAQEAGLSSGEIVNDDEMGLASGEIVDFNDDDDFDDDFDVDGELVLAEAVSDGEHVNIVQRSSTGEEIPYSIDLSTPPLNKNEAIELTERIRNTTNLLWVLIKRAHAGKAWAALGYSSFEEYAKEEFHISRSYAYKLLNQANVIEAIQDKVPEGTTFSLTAGQAADIKPVLPAVLAQIEERIDGVPASEAGQMIEDVMREDLARRRSEAEDEAEDEYQGDRPYNPDYVAPDDDDDDDEAQPGVLAEQEDEELTATRSKYERLFNFYTTLRNMTEIGHVDDLVELVPDNRRPHFVEFLALCVPMLTRFNEDFSRFIAENPSEDEDDIDIDDDEDLDDDDQ
jgi:hypothetical protein